MKGKVWVFRLIIDKVLVGGFYFKWFIILVKKVFFIGFEMGNFVIKFVFFK